MIFLPRIVLWLFVMAAGVSAIIALYPIWLKQSEQNEVLVVASLIEHAADVAKDPMPLANGLAVGGSTVLLTSSSVTTERGLPLGTTVPTQLVPRNIHATYAVWTTNGVGSAATPVSLPLTLLINANRQMSVVAGTATGLGSLPAPCVELVIGVPGRNGAAADNAVRFSCADTTRENQVSP